MLNKIIIKLARAMIFVHICLASKMDISYSKDYLSVI